MPISAQLDHWLSTSGYEYHCFISWARTGDFAMTKLVAQLKIEIENSLRRWLNPKVYLDEVETRGGDLWEKTLQRSLCKSITMVSLCAPIYYHPNHHWCGREWAAMDGLSEKRIPKGEFKTIIPVILERDEGMPEVIAQIKYLDFSGLILQGRNYFRTNAFRANVEKIVSRIDMIAHALQANNAQANCHEFEFPKTSAFAGHHSEPPRFPFRD